MALAVLALVLWLAAAGAGPEREPSIPPSDPAEPITAPISASLPTTEELGEVTGHGERTVEEIQAPSRRDPDDSTHSVAATLASTQAHEPPAPPPPPPNPPDADAGEACRSGTLHLPPSPGTLGAEVVVTLDSNGSLVPRLSALARWLHALEAGLARTAPNTRLTVLADLDTLQRRNGGERPVLLDGGSVQQEPVGPSNALWVLSTPVQPWLKQLRAGAPVHMVVISDSDATTAMASQFLSGISLSLNGRLETARNALHLHGLLGFRPNPGAEVLNSTDPINAQVCGAKAGIAYQQLSIQTNGLRGSLCDDAALDAFGAALLDTIAAPITPRSCTLTLPAGAVVTDVRAGGQRLLAVPPGGWDCLHGASAYTTTDRQLTLCPETCPVVATSTLDVTLRCEVGTSR